LSQSIPAVSETSGFLNALVLGIWCPLAGPRTMYHVRRRRRARASLILRATTESCHQTQKFCPRCDARRMRHRDAHSTCTGTKMPGLRRGLQRAPFTQHWGMRSKGILYKQPLLPISAIQAQSHPLSPRQHSFMCMCVCMRVCASVRVRVRKKRRICACRRYPRAAKSRDT